MTTLSPEVNECRSSLFSLSCQSRLGESGHVSSPASQSESTCGSPAEQSGGGGGGGSNGHPPEGQPSIQQQQGGPVGSGPGSGSLTSRTMTSSTPTYSSSPASWTLAPPSDNSLGNSETRRIFFPTCIHYYLLSVNRTTIPPSIRSLVSSRHFPQCRHHFFLVSGVVRMMRAFQSHPQVGVEARIKFAALTHHGSVPPTNFCCLSVFSQHHRLTSRVVIDTSAGILPYSSYIRPSFSYKGLHFDPDSTWFDLCVFHCLILSRLLCPSVCRPVIFDSISASTRFDSIKLRGPLLAYWLHFRQRSWLHAVVDYNRRNPWHIQCRPDI